MKILYGACGQGMGHVTRSLVVAEHLDQMGHDVTFVCAPGRPFEWIRARRRVLPIVGLEMVLGGGKLHALATWKKNQGKVIRILDSARAFLRDRPELRPDVVLTDFDPWATAYATLAKLPLIAVDNVHFSNRCEHPPDVLSTDWVALCLMVPTVEAIVPTADRYLVTTLVRAPICRPRTTLHLPILRPAVISARGAPNHGHLVCYLNDQADHVRVIEALRDVGALCRVYGTRVKSEQTDRTVTLCPFSDERFVEDLATCSAVVGGAGFTLMSEAVYLGKPMLAIPFGGQFEQILNANYLGRLGWGERCDRLSVERLVGFLERAPAYAEALRTYQHDGNRELLASLDAALSGELHRHRQRTAAEGAPA